jgi:hypothetical protein
MSPASLTSKRLVNRNSFLLLAASQADGSSLGYSPSQLFDQKEAESNVKPESTVGVYGAADEGSQHNRPQGANLGRFKFYHVTVKRDCAEDDPWRDR